MTNPLKQTASLSLNDNEPKHNTRTEVAETLNWSPGKTAQAEQVKTYQKKVVDNTLFLFNGFIDLKIPKTPFKLNPLLLVHYCNNVYLCCATTTTTINATQ